MSGAQCDLGLIGLAVMGENLVLNFISKGFKIAVHNRTETKITNFLQGRGAEASLNKTLFGFPQIEDFVNSLAKPRKIMLMVQAGNVTDIWIDKVAAYLDKGDIIIDGGNSNFNDTERRVKACQDKGILFVGSGVSGGEEGALKGPSIMPGGNKEAWDHVKGMLQKISAQVKDEKDGNTVPCCDWLGEGGAGHYVKMVHNGIEYGDMQLICEAYFLMKEVLEMDNDEMSKQFKEWDNGDLESYLIEITSDILGKKDENGKYVVDLILDAAGQKGTGKWTAINALDLGMPLTLIGEAVFARCLSAQKEERKEASQVLKGPAKQKFSGDKTKFLNNIRDALFASKIVSYAQGFVVIKKASEEYKWDINLGKAALMWRGGCIIRSKFLDKIKAAFDKEPQPKNLLLDEFFKNIIHEAQAGWREVCAEAVKQGIPCPAFQSALAYYDGYRTECLPANLLQAQRDYFGAHQYELLENFPERGKFAHFNWTGRGGATASTVYNK